MGIAGAEEIILAISPERGGGAQRRKGFRRYAEYHFGSTEANSYRPLGFPRGEAGAFSGSSEPMKVTEEGWRQPKYCLHFVRWYQPQIIADYFPLFSFNYHMEKVFIKQAPFSAHRTIHENFGARHPSSVFFGNRFRSADCQKIQLPPGGSQGGRYEFAQGFIKPQVPTATPQPLRRQLSSALSGCTPSRTATPAKPFRGA